MIKVAAYKNKKTRRSGYAFEAKTMDGVVLFTGGASNGRKPHQLSVQYAIGKAIIKTVIVY